MRLVVLLLLSTVMAHAGEPERVLRALARRQRTLASLVDANAGLVIGTERDDAAPAVTHACGEALSRTLPRLQHDLVAELRRAD